MSWNNLKAGIAAVVRENGNQEITGENLQTVINAVVNSLGAHATYAGIATPSTSPGTPDGPVFYFAMQKGRYPNFSNILVTDTDGAVILLYRDGVWSKSPTGFARQSDMAEVREDIFDIKQALGLDADSSTINFANANATNVLVGYCMIGEEDETELYTDPNWNVYIFPYSLEMTRVITETALNESNFPGILYLTGTELTTRIGGEYPTGHGSSSYDIHTKIVEIGTADITVNAPEGTRYIAVNTHSPMSSFLCFGESNSELLDQLAAEISEANARVRSAESMAREADRIAREAIAIASGVVPPGPEPVFTAATLTETIHTNKAWGAIPAGTTLEAGTTLQEIAEMATVEEIAATAALSSSPAPVLKEEGTSQSVILSAVVTKNSATRLISVTFYKGNAEIETISDVDFGEAVSCSQAQTITTGTSFKVRARYVRKDGETEATCESNTISYPYTHYSYWGSVNEGVIPTAAMIEAFTNKELVGQKHKTIQSTAGKVLVYAYPKSFGALTSIYADYQEYLNDYTRIEVSINGVPYYAYYQNNVSNIAITYEFK